jgi:DDE superfamily endonuclease/Helix-turn-helix of DDE superfamily endonuclease
MSISYKKLVSKPKVFQKLSGLDVKEFEIIAQKLEPTWKELQESKKLDGRPSKLDGLRDTLLATLIYSRTYVTYEFLGFLFGLDVSNIWRAIKKIEPMVIKVVAIKKDRTLTSDELMNLIVDVTEQPINRPKNRQRKFYSGKKKRHTLKTEILINKKGKIISASRPHQGKRHDMSIRRRSGKLPQKSEVLGDSGYQGLQYEQIKTKIPIKKQKGKPRTKEDKKYNKELSSQRVLVENIICKLKDFKVLKDQFRSRRNRYAVVMQIIAALVNLKMRF